MIWNPKVGENNLEKLYEFLDKKISMNSLKIEKPPQSDDFSPQIWLTPEGINLLMSYKSIKNSDIKFIFYDFMIKLRVFTYSVKLW